MSEFEEMLKKNAFRCHFKELENYCKEPNPEVLPIHALGEWAANEMIKNAWGDKALDFLSNGDAQQAFYSFHVVKEIADACLGKKEVERRLSEAGKQAGEKE